MTAAVKLRPQTRKLEVPERIRKGQRAYNKAQRDGHEPTAAQRKAHRQYEHLRWDQLAPEDKRLAAKQSNATRAERERIFGRPPTTASAQARYRAQVKLIKKHRREFERLLMTEEQADAVKQADAVRT